MEKLVLYLIGLSFLGFMTGLVGKNSGNHKKKSFRMENFYKHLITWSVIIMLACAFLYSILFY